jgi:hypothetical protein
VAKLRGIANRSPSPFETDSAFEAEGPPFRATPTFAELRASGAESLRAIAAGLNARGIPTARGAGQWSAVQVARVIERAG